jgi:uncharacterized membrane protein YhaH (DUF805 family)
MKQNRLIFYSIFGVLHLFIFVFSLYMDRNSEDLSLLISLQGKIWMLKYCSLTLLIMFGTSVVLHVRDNNRNKRLHDAHQREITELKAKLYDKGQDKKTPTPTA